jgi:hypothetical protein
MGNFQNFPRIVVILNFFNDFLWFCLGFKGTLLLGGGATKKSIPFFFPKKKKKNDPIL